MERLDDCGKKVCEGKVKMSEGKEGSEGKEENEGKEQIKWKGLNILVLSPTGRNHSNPSLPTTVHTNPPLPITIHTN